MGILFSVSFLSCENPLENRVNELEKKLEQQEQDRTKLEARMDSLVLVIQDQNAVINSTLINRQRVIDSLTTLFNHSLDSLNFEQQEMIDSLIAEQNSIIDSMYSYQQEMIEGILESQVKSEFVETEVFNGVCPQNWTDIDVSSIVGKKKTLLIFRADRLSDDSTPIVFRPNGETVDWFSEDPTYYEGRTSSLSIISLGYASSVLGMVYTDENGIVEMRANRSDKYEVPEVTISLKLEYYLN